MDRPHFTGLVTCQMRTQSSTVLSSLWATEQHQQYWILNMWLLNLKHTSHSPDAAVSGHGWQPTQRTFSFNWCIIWIEVNTWNHLHWYGSLNSAKWNQGHFYCRSVLDGTKQPTQKYKTAKYQGHAAPVSRMNRLIPYQQPSLLLDYLTCLITSLSVHPVTCGHSNSQLANAIQRPGLIRISVSVLSAHEDQLRQVNEAHW